MSSILQQYDEMRAAEKPTQKTDADGDKKPTQGQIIMEIVQAEAELWHDEELEAWATVPVGKHREHHPIRSRAFRRWVERRFYQREGKTPSNNAWQDARGTIEGMARWDGEQHTVHLRVAEHDDAYYIDLADARWRAVKVTRDGWEIVDDPPVRFRRAAGMLPLPEPRRGGSIEDLRPFVNVATEDDFRLLVAWLVAAYRPRGPYPILILQGEQGTAKSTTLRVLRRCVDPATVEMGSEPRNEHDLAITAVNSGIIAFDNLSGVRVWLSDALARISTGGGFRTRTLYENDEETLFSFTKPIILNGIDDIATRHDLADRSIILHLPVIPDSERKTEAEFWTAWRKAEAGVIGAILDAVSVAMSRVDDVHLSAKPRMADFALWATAAEPAFGWANGTFLGAYLANRKEAIDAGIESDTVGAALLSFVADHPDGWEGITKDLVPRLERYVPESVRATRGWPATPEAMANRLRRIAPAMRQAGISITRAKRTSRGKPWRIEQENACIQPAQPAQPAQNDANTHRNGVSASAGWSASSNNQHATSTELALPEKPMDKGFAGVGAGSASSAGSVQGFSFDENEVAASDDEWEVF